jgi:phosphate starvation-inducible protein PhoH
MQLKNGENKQKTTRSASMNNLAVDYIEDLYNTRNDKDILKFNRRSKRKTQIKQKQSLQLQNVTPMTANQKRVFALYDKGENVLLHGVAGTGKTFLSMYLALDDVMNGNDNKDRVVIIRSAVPSRDMGFLPGKEAEKTAVYEQPYNDICSEIMNRGDGYSILKTKGMVEFISTSYIRGTTIDNAVVIVDEFQNMTDSELNTIMTRIGTNTRVLICGDFRQTDLTRSWDSSGAQTLIALWGKMGHKASKVEFGIEDIVRSGFVKQWIEARIEMGLI